MHQMPPKPQSSSRASLAEASTANLLRQVMRENIEVPLAALRASLENLSTQARSGKLRPRTLESSAQQFSEVSRRVQTLIDFCQPPTLHPENCRLSQVLHSATAQLTGKARQKLAIAYETPSSLLVDTSRLGHCLAQWIELVSDEGASQVLLIARGDSSTATFSLLSDEHVSPHQIHELQRRLLEKEVARMGGSVRCAHRHKGSALTIQFEGSSTSRSFLPSQENAPADGRTGEAA